MHPTPRRRLGEWQEITGELNMNSTGKIVQLVNPTANQDAATKSYVDTKFNNVPTPTNTNDAANKGYVDTKFNNVTTPTNTTDAANKGYVDTQLGSNGTQANWPTIQRDDTTSATRYLTFIDSSDIPGDGLSKRALMRTDANLYYNPNVNTLYAGLFSGNLSGSATGSAGDISKASDSTFTVNGSERMRITSAGRVGIGTTSPRAILDVVGTTDTRVLQATYGGYIDGTGYGNTHQADRHIVACFSGGWVASQSGFIILSDQRIKSDIVTLDANISLELYRKLRVVKHSYIDKKNFGNITKYGFIAQEVLQLLPDAVIPKTDFIPSIYKTATFVNDQTLHFDNPLKDIQQFNIGTKLKCYDVKNEIVWATIKCVIDTQNIEIEELNTNDKLFVYGHSVDDFLQIDYDHIHNIATAALQEVDRQQQADKVRIAELEAKVSAQQSLINDILERLKTLERA